MLGRLSIVRPKPQSGLPLVVEEDTPCSLNEFGESGPDDMMGVFFWVVFILLAE